jgi:hypothetical protein
VIRAGQIHHLDHLDHLVEVLDDLLDLAVVADGDQRQPRQGRILGGSNGQALDVVVALGEQPDDPGQGPGLVLEQNGNE